MTRDGWTPPRVWRVILVAALIGAIVGAGLAAYAWIMDVGPVEHPAPLESDVVR